MNKKWRSWYQNKVDEEINGVSTSDKVKHNESSDQLLLARLHILSGVRTSNGRRRLSSSVIACNTPRRTCRQLHPCRAGDDIMPPAV